MDGLENKIREEDIKKSTSQVYSLASNLSLAAIIVLAGVGYVRAMDRTNGQHLDTYLFKPVAEYKLYMHHHDTIINKIEGDTQQGPCLKLAIIKKDRYEEIHKSIQDESKGYFGMMPASTIAGVEQVATIDGKRIAGIKPALKQF